MCQIKSAVLHKHPSKCPLSSGSYQNNEKIKSQSISPKLKTCLILKSKSKTFRSKSGNTLSSSRKVVDELLFLNIQSNDSQSNNAQFMHKLSKYGWKTILWEVTT